MPRFVFALSVVAANDSTDAANDSADAAKDSADAANDSADAAMSASGRIVVFQRTFSLFRKEGTFS